MRVAWELEWAVARRRRRLFVLNTTIPLALVGPLVLGGAPAAHASAALAVLFVLFGVFGSAIPLVRDAEAGLVERLVVAGLRPADLLGGRAAATTALDGLQLLPSLLLALGAAGAPPRLWAATAATLLLALGAANLLGIWIAGAARSVAEAALFAAVSALLLLHAGGTFRTPAPDSTAAALERWIPFRPLHEALLVVAGGGGAGGPAVGAGESLPGWTAGWSPALDGALPGLTCLVLLGLTLAAAGPLAERLGKAGR